MVKIASCQYQIESLANWESYQNKIDAILLQAQLKDARLLLLPEYAGIEIAFNQYATDALLFKAIQPFVKQYIAFYQQLAQRYQIYIQPGTIIEEIADNRYANRAYFFSPNGTYSYQDKLQLTEYEKLDNLLLPGSQQTIFNTAIGKIGIAICYDSEFPEVVHHLTQAGATLILVPSYTATLSGYHRVFLSARARAIENQCYVAVSYVVNEVHFGAQTDCTNGQATILSPADTGFPDDGIIASGKMNEVSMVIGEISTDKIAFVRQNGQVHNFADRADYAPKILMQKITL